MTLAVRMELSSRHRRPTLGALSVCDLIPFDGGGFGIALNGNNAFEYCAQLYFVCDG
jgi:hypothetical protein